MKKRIVDGGVEVTADIPVFVGSTSNQGFFQRPGESAYKLYFQPDPGVTCYLVFDLEDVERRTPTSPTFLYLDRTGPEGKLVYREGLQLDRSVHGGQCAFDRSYGLIYYCLDGHPVSMYYTGKPSTQGFKKVSILDLLRFIEGRITLEELDTMVIAQ